MGAVGEGGGGAAAAAAAAAAAQVTLPKEEIEALFEAKVFAKGADKDDEGGGGGEGDDGGGGLGGPVVLLSANRIGVLLCPSKMSRDSIMSGERASEQEYNLNKSNSSTVTRYPDARELRRSRARNCCPFLLWKGST